MATALTQKHTARTDSLRLPKRPATLSRASLYPRCDYCSNTDKFIQREGICSEPHQVGIWWMHHECVTAAKENGLRSLHARTSILPRLDDDAIPAAFRNKRPKSDQATPGTTFCLHCQKTFFSPDRKTRRLCPPCTQSLPKRSLGLSEDWLSAESTHDHVEFDEETPLDSSTPLDEALLAR